MLKTWFITGTSSGFGLSLTEILLKKGHRVAATLRRADRLASLKEQYGDQVWLADLDVNNKDAIKSVLASAFAKLGRIDVICSNAGYGVFGAAEELTDDQVEGLVATNLMGSIHLARAAIPHLRTQGGGHLLQISSQGGQIAFPGFAMYHVAKWGIEGFYEALAPEVEPFGIKVTLVEPGIIRTPFYDAAVRAEPLEYYSNNPALDLTRGEVPAELLTGDQEKCAQGMIDVTEQSDPPFRLLQGSDAFERVKEALTRRLAAVEAQREIAASTDID